MIRRPPRSTLFPSTTPFRTSITWPKEQPPTVKTEPANPVAQTSATLNGVVNPNGSEVTECKFEYGTTTAYDKTATCPPPPGSGSSNVAVATAISSLSEGTEY